MFFNFLATFSLYLVIIITNFYINYFDNFKKFKNTLNFLAHFKFVKENNYKLFSVIEVLELILKRIFMASNGGGVFGNCNYNDHIGEGIKIYKIRIETNV